MNHYNSYLIIIIFVFSAFYAGCIDDSVNDSSVKIEGMVYDIDGMYNPYILVSVNDYPIVAPDRQGRFSLDNKIFPYDLITADGHITSQKYLGLTIQNPQILTHEDHGSSNYCNVKISFPQITSLYDKALIKFISKDNCRDNEISAYYEDSFMYKFIDIMNDKSTIEGKIIFLQYTLNSFDEIVSFNKFGMKDVTLNTGLQPEEIIFTENDVNYDPQEIEVNFNINLSNSFRYCNSKAYMLFSGFDPGSALLLYSNIFDITYGNIILPQLPQLSYKVKFINHADYGNTYLTSKSWVIKEPGENINLTHYSTLRLQQPSNYSENVNDNTVFSVTDNSPGGIYVFRAYSFFWNNYQEISVVTDKPSIYFKDFKTWGYQFRNNVQYQWGVFKYPGYKNIDEFASKKYTEDTLDGFIPASEIFIFTVQQ